jgi:hypothetical protein
MDYSDFLQLEQFSHQKLGGFNPNSLFTRTVESADLLPLNRKPWDAALPVHIHEYVHFLHNISTPSGIVFLFNGFNFFFEFMKGTDRRGIFDPNGFSPESSESFVKIYSLLQGGLVGIKPPSDVKINRWNFGEPDVQEVPLTIFGHQFDTFSKTRIEVEAISSYGGSYEFALDVGINFITEGVAYEIDREVRRKIGAWKNQDLDEHTPSYPYLIYQPLIDNLVGRKTSLYERLILGTCALIDISPGKGLLRACEMLKACKTTVSRGFFEYILRLNRGLHGFRDDLKYEVMPNMLRNFQGSKSLQGGLKEYLKFISISLDKRCATPLMELEFIHVTSHEIFFRKIARLVPQWLCQEKLDGKAEISLIGDPVMVGAIDEAALSALQSAFHYVQLHLKSDGTVIGTSEIPSIQCPFLGSCPERSRANDPGACSTKPWNTTFNETEKIKEPTCYYNYGVRSLFFETDF